jgi:hypothetical protein
MNAKRSFGYPIAAFFIASLFVFSLLAFAIPKTAFADGTIHYVTTDGNCGSASPCYSSIQAAVLAANNYDQIRVAQGTYSQISTGDGITGVVLIVNKVVSISGGYTISDWNTSNPSTNLTVIDPQNNGVGIYITHHEQGIAYITIDGFTITNGNATDAGAGTDSGGGIFIDQTAHKRVTITNCDIFGNTAEDKGGVRSGGGIWGARTDNFHLLNSNIHDNIGSGVVITYSANPVIQDSVIEDNQGVGILLVSASGTSTDISRNQITNNQGRGIAISTVLGGSLTNNTITDNVAESNRGGGGLDIIGAINNFLIGNNTILRNTSLQGAGINISGSIAQIVNNTIESNTTTASSNGGGGLYVNSGAAGAYVLVSGNQIISNTSTNMGGGMVIVGMVDVLYNTIQNNTGFSGGGIVATSTGTITGNLISGNRAQIGGGIRAVNPMGLSIERNNINDNHATNGNGGGMSLWGGSFMDLSLDANQVIANTATTSGGGIYLECPNGVDPIQISNTVLAKNQAANGGGLYSTVCDVDLAYSTIVSNDGGVGDGAGLYLRHPTGTSEYLIENAIVVDQKVGIYVQSGVADLDAIFWGTGSWENDANTGGSGTINTGTHIYQGNPGFFDPVENDFHILSDSAVIDLGIDTWISTDMDRESRATGASDIGADEYFDGTYLYLPLIIK